MTPIYFEAGVEMRAITTALADIGLVLYIGRGQMVARAVPPSLRALPSNVIPLPARLRAV